ncbi:hypothetical protein CBW42_00605 [Butyricicoccus porcorum]|uniref:Uncharacterized protein n=2 Tax=Butyricicoccus porcorum TaxID=1945634 RepID=A0A252F7L9_9FIRM|nr:hypothetical protein CBW42_00605 [Butyricicoccus porcorum]
MKEYDVKITETLEKTVTVEAKSRADAEEQVRSAYYNSEYILDSENFTGVEFGTTEEREIQQEQAETMTVLLVKPHMYPQQVQIGCDLEDLQKAVGGDIEAVYPFNEPVALVMHDEGKIMGKDLNRALRDGDGEIYDIIAGDFLVVGLGEEDFSSLSPELMKQFEEHFHQPETFVRMGRSIMALPLPDDMSSIPLGENLIHIQRGLTTSSTAIFVPFTVQELFQSGEALYYGLNALSNNMILCDRKRLKNPNGLILGTPGSGKSFSAKREITNAFLITADDIIICDPEAEYYPLVERLKGQVIKVSQNSTQYINPMDINLNYSEGDTPIALKSDFILSFCELIMGGKNGLEAVEKTLIDRAVISVYRSYLADPKPENMPVLGDLYNEIRKQPEKEAQRIASALELYVNGSLNLFNHRTNVDIHNRLVCFDIKELGTQLKKVGMLIIQDQVWNRVTLNRSEGKATRYYIDEFHLLLKEEQTAAYSVEIWKRFRKWGGIPTGITQNVKDLLTSREVSNVFENSDFVYMLNQAQGDREILAKQLNISQQQMTYVTHSDAGEGLIFYGNVILPFIDRFPQDTELYRVMTTKPGEVSA